MKVNNNNKVICVNCGKYNHYIKNCKEPVSSWGIINILIKDTTDDKNFFKKFFKKKKKYLKVESRKYPNISYYISDNFKITLDIHEYNKNCIYRLNNESITFQNEEQLLKFSYYKDKIYFMMVSRRFSLGFIEFLRGKYDVNNPETIIKLFQHMYDNEVTIISNNTFNDLLYLFFRKNDEDKNIVLNRIYTSKYANEYIDSGKKFDLLCISDNNENFKNLYFYITNIKPLWKTPEWGFPKGRRENVLENNIMCARREFEEETGYKHNEYTILDKIEPIEEKIIGTNGIRYTHIYYLAMDNRLDFNLSTNFDTCEIGSIKWFSYNEAMIQIRPHHIKKKEILTRIYLFLLNYLINNVC